MWFCSVLLTAFVSIFFFKQKTAYELRISDWSSDVCSSDLGCGWSRRFRKSSGVLHRDGSGSRIMAPMAQQVQYRRARQPERSGVAQRMDIDATLRREPRVEHHADAAGRSEEHTSELQSLMRNSYAVFCLKKKKTNTN